MSIEQTTQHFLVMLKESKKATQKAFANSFLLHYLHNQESILNTSALLAASCVFRSALPCLNGLKA